MRLRRTWNDLTHRLTGLSLFGFGVSRQPPPYEKGIVRRLLVFIEDRATILLSNYHSGPRHIFNFVKALRDQITAAIVDLPDASPAIPPLRAMLSACREFLPDADSSIDFQERLFRSSPECELRAKFDLRLANLRAAIGHELALLCSKYEIDLEGQILTILPPRS